MDRDRTSPSLRTRVFVMDRARSSSSRAVAMRVSRDKKATQIKLPMSNFCAAKPAHVKHQRRPKIKKAQNEQRNAQLHA
ncbi:hypothetical protein TZ53_06390 [Sphingobium sp. YBL2]|nr:hypothetical protein TZ53_06390 [Sphingobium sp. YBL2]